MSIRLRRRDFIAGLGGAAAWPLAARGQQPMPVVAWVVGSTADNLSLSVAAFRKGMSETGYIEGQNVTIEYHWLAGQYERLPALMSDLVRRRVTLIVDGALAAKAATATIPIVFAVGQDPVKRGLVASLARPGGNATGINFLSQELSAKRLQLLHELVPRATRIAVVVNPANANAESILSDVQEAARVLGMQVVVLHAGTISQIDAAFAALAREHADALFVAGDAFLSSRRVQFAILAARDRVPASYGGREYAEVGALISYGTSNMETARQAGVYTGNILKGAKPAELPVQQAVKFQLVINLGTARALGIEVPPTLLALADEVIE